LPTSAQAESRRWTPPASTCRCSRPPSPGSSTSTAAAPRPSRASNDGIAAAIAAHPDRFAGFAALPTADPPAAAAELERAVRTLELVGALVNGRTLERFLDDQFFWPIFESAEALGVPIYLYPMPPPKAVYDIYYAGFGDDVGFMLGAGAWAGTSRRACTHDGSCWPACSTASPHSR